MLKLACCPQLDRNAVLTIPLQHPTLRILNFTHTLCTEVEEAGQIWWYCKQLLVFAVTPAYVVCEKQQWISLLTKFNNLGFEDLYMQAFLAAGVPYELIYHTFWLEEH